VFPCRQSEHRKTLKGPWPSGYAPELSTAIGISRDNIDQVLPLKKLPKGLLDNFNFSRFASPLTFSLPHFSGETRILNFVQLVSPKTMQDDL